MNQSPPKQVTYPGLKLVVTVAAFMIIVAGLRSAESFLVPFVFSIFLATIGFVPLRMLRSLRVPKFASVMIVALFMMALLVGVGTLLASSVNEFTNALPRYSSRFDLMQREFFEWLEGKGIEYSSAMVVDSLQPSSFLELVGSTLRSLVTTVSSTLLVFILMVFMLFEAADFEKKLRFAMGDAFDSDRFEGVAIDIQRYLGIKTVTSMMTGIFVAVLNLAMGIEFWILWGLAAFLMNYVPFIGSFLASIPAVILALIQFGPGAALTVAIGYLVVNVGVSNFLEPVFMGRRLGLSPLVVFLSLIVWGWIWGPAGMLLSVPLTMIFKILLEHSEEFKWIATLMGHNPKTP